MRAFVCVCVSAYNLSALCHVCVCCTHVCVFVFVCVPAANAKKRSLECSVKCVCVRDLSNA